MLQNGLLISLLISIIVVNSRSVDVPATSSGVKNCPNGCVCYTAPNTYMICSNVKSLPEIDKSVPWYDIIITCARRNSVWTIPNNYFRQHKKLELIQISFCSIADLGRAFRNFSSLRSLKFSFVPIKRITNTTFERTNNMEIFRFENTHKENFKSDYIAKDAFKHFSHLRSITISLTHTSLTDDMIQSIQPKEAFIWRQNGDVRITTDAFKTFGYIRKLHVVNSKLTSSTFVRNVYAQEISVSGNTNLGHLTLVKEQRTILITLLAKSCGLQNVPDGLGFLYKLEHLDLAMNEIQCVNSEQFFGFPHLKYLSFRLNRITSFDAGFAMLLDRQPKMELLLSGNPLDCDCRLKWMLKSKDKLVMMSGIECDDRELTKQLVYLNCIYPEPEHISITIRDLLIKGPITQHSFVTKLETGKPYEITCQVPTNPSPLFTMVATNDLFRPRSSLRRSDGLDCRTPRFALHNLTFRHTLPSTYAYVSSVVTCEIAMPNVIAITVRKSFSVVPGSADKSKQIVSNKMSSSTAHSTAHSTSKHFTVSPAPTVPLRCPRIPNSAYIPSAAELKAFVVIVSFLSSSISKVIDTRCM